MNSRMWGIIGGFALVLALLSPYILGSTKKVERLFKAAEVLYEQNDYAEAIVKYDEALKESKKVRAKTETIDQDFTTFVNFKIAMSYVKLAEQEDNSIHYEKALEYIEKAAQTVTFREYEGNLTYLRGYIFYKTEQLALAVTVLTELIESFPGNSFVGEARKTIVHIRQQQELSAPIWTEDLSKFEAFTQKKSSNLFIPNRLRLEEQYTAAAEQYEVFVNSNPSTIETAYALYWIGWCYYEAASAEEILFGKSRVAFRKLIDNHAESPYVLKAREKLSELERRLAKNETYKVIIAAENAVRQAEQSKYKSTAISKAITRLNNAKEAQERGNYAEATRLANDARKTAEIAIDNHSRAKQSVEQGYNYLKQGRLESATQKAKEALRVDPLYQEADNLLKKVKQKYFNQGVKYIEEEEYAKAIPLLKKAINIEPSNEVYSNLGWAYVKIGEFEQAIAAAKKSLTIDPNDKLAQKILNSIEDTSGD